MSLRKLTAITALNLALVDVGSYSAPAAESRDRCAMTALSNGGETDSEALKDIFSFFSGIKDERERIVYYFPNSRATVDVTEDSDSRLSKPDLNKIQALPSDDYVIITHNHYLSLDGYLTFAQPTLLEIAMIKRANPELTEQRMFLEAPSSLDIAALAYEEKAWRSKSPNARIRHILVRRSRYNPSRAIEYGLCNEITGSVEDAVKNIVSAYVQAYDAYTQDTLKPGDAGPGKEADINEFIVKLQQGSAVFIRDLGFANPFQKALK